MTVHLALLSSPYVDVFLKPHVQEVLETLPTDRIFFDIVQPQDCSCVHCRAQMGPSFLLHGLARLALLSIERDHCPLEADYTAR